MVFCFTMQFITILKAEQIVLAKIIVLENVSKKENGKPWKKDTKVSTFLLRLTLH